MIKSKFLLFLFSCCMFLSVCAQEKMAVMDFKACSQLTQADAESFTGAFVTYFHPNGYVVLDKGSVHQLMEEKHLKADLTQESQMIKVGNKLKLSKMIMGNINYLGNKFSVDVRVVDLRTGGIVCSDGMTFSWKKYRKAAEKMAKRVALKMETEITSCSIELVENKPENNPAPAPAPVPTPAPVQVDTVEKESGGAEKKVSEAPADNHSGHSHVTERERRCLEKKVTDYDGNTYSTIYFGHQCWTKENMRSTRAYNGKSLVYYSPHDDVDNVSEYGYLYDWKSAMEVCPTGWHLPTNDEWLALEEQIKEDERNVCANKPENIAKSMAAGWGWEESPYDCAIGNNVNTNNSSGFSVLPAGIFNSGYFGFGVYANFWCATEMQNGFAYDHGFNCNNTKVIRYVDGKESGFSVRCVRN